METWGWGIIGVLLTLLGLGIPVGYGIRFMLQEIMGLLQSVKGLIESVRETVTNVNDTVNQMSAFIDRNEQQHYDIQRDVNNLRESINTNVNRVMDGIHTIKKEQS